MKEKNKSKMIKDTSKSSNDINDASNNDVLDDDDGETRCICNNVDPPDDSGLYIQCEECSIWQHGYCMGIIENETPDKYWCEQCKPELHTLYVESAGKKRSHYKPVYQRRRKFRRVKREVDSNMKLDEKDDEVTESNSYSRQSDDQGSGEESKRVLDRKRATSSAREEKQYQLMLEKAIRESRRTSQPDEELKNNSSLDSRSICENTGAQDNVKYNRETRENYSMGPESTLIGTSSRKRSRNGSAKSTSSSEDDNKHRSKRSLIVNFNKVSRDRSCKMNNSNHTNIDLDIAIDKPIKPRLPGQRTNLTEMRRRINAILEFISRTQLEFSHDRLEQEKLTQFVENQEFVMSVKGIFQNYEVSLQIMDDLTRRLLLWEQKYFGEK